MPMMEKVDYLKLKTLADVKRQRVRVGDRLDEVEARLKGDYAQLTGMFDFGYIAESVARKMAKLYSIIEVAFSGYDLVRNLIGQYRSRKDHAGDDE